MKAKEILKNIFLIPVYLYKGLLSPYMGHSCRYIPSCSSYFVKAVRKHGIIKGSILGVMRILRCSPFFLGGPDDVPDTFSFKGIRDDYIRFRKRKA